MEAIDKKVVVKLEKKSNSKIIFGNKEYDEEELINTRKVDSDYYSIHWIICRQARRRLSEKWCKKYPHHVDELPVPEWKIKYFNKHCLNELSHKYAIITI